MVSNQSEELNMDSTTATTTTTTTTSTSVVVEDDAWKKIRKPYTISKSRESWTDPEHDKFLEALQLFDRDWKKIEAFVGSKTVIQIRSHAQKYFLKVQRSGTSEHLPPPRPKRKAAHPYPHKAAKTDPVFSITTEPVQSSSTRVDSRYELRPEYSSTPMNPNIAQTINLPNTLKGPTSVPNYCSSTESTPEIRIKGETNDQSNVTQSMKVLPDFAQVYSFIGSVFDPNITGHLQKLKTMDPIDVETALWLMRNLSINLTSSDFEDHRRLVSSFETESEKTKYNEKDKTLA